MLTTSRSTHEKMSAHLNLGDWHGPCGEWFIENRTTGRTVMLKKTFVMIAMFAAVATPVLAMGPFYVMFDNAAKKCVMSRTAKSDTAKFAMMGQYKTEADAKMAMKGMTKCRG